MITVALSKGYLLKEELALFTAAGVRLPKEIDSRKLIFSDLDKQYRFMILRPADVPVYVEYGAADIGITGKDVLEENDQRLVELGDLKFGKCSLVAAAKNDYSKGYFTNMKVATKFTHSAERFFLQKGIHVELIKLYGSVEVAPLVDLADIIIDLTATGTTLKENGLKIIDTVYESTARLVSNKASLQLYYPQLISLTEKILSQV